MTREQERDIITGGMAMRLLAECGMVYEDMIESLLKEVPGRSVDEAREYIETMEDCIGFRFTRAREAA